MPKQKTNKSFKTLRFSSTRGFDRNQRMLTSLFNRANSANGIDSQTNEEPDALVENITQERNEEQISETVEDSVEDVDTEETSDTLPDNSVLTDYFEELQARLANEEYPFEYKNGTFWIEPMMTFFALRKKKDANYLYRPRVFLWIPHLLINQGLEGIRCPRENCKKSLETKGYNKKPHARRIVDMFSCFYLMSVRYRCCDRKCGASFNAHDSEIVEQLPLELQVEFPAILTHRGGISKAVADLLRPCIQNSVGPERFQKILRELHMLRHDRVELQYLLSEYNKRSGISQYFSNSPPEDFSSFNDQKRYAGFVPTGTYIRTIYTEIIKVLQPRMDKHMMLLDGKILKGDHSFKFPKHMAKIDDTSVFTGLYTMTNEYEEIVHQVLVPSKALSYLKHSFEKMREAYFDYGHQMPIAFFTDNVKGDQSFVEGIFESLKEGVEPADLERINTLSTDSSYLQLPCDINILYLCRDFDSMEISLRALFEEIKSSAEEGGDVAIGFDCEWDICYSEGVDSCRVDVIQIAFAKNVYVLHIDRCWTSLPISLMMILEDENIKKVGRQVGGDLSRLAKSMCVNCKGKLELGSFCSSRKVVSSGATSLSAISLSVLGKSIQKSERETQWSSEILSSKQIEYAAIDAWASLTIYEAIKAIPETGSRINSKNCIPGTFVSLKPRGLKHVVASGQIEQIKDNKHVEKGSCLFRVTKVYIPSYMVNPENLDNRQNNEARNSAAPVCLGSFSELGFVIKVFNSDLITAPREEVQEAGSSVRPPSQRISVRPNAVVVNSLNDSEKNVEVVGSINDADVDIAFNTMFPDNFSNVDRKSFEHGYQLFTSNLRISHEIVHEQHDDKRVFTRVVKDVFHLMDMIRPYKQHGLYKEFTQRFSDSLFVLDEDDKKLVSDALAKNGESWEMKMKYDRNWIWERVKRKICSPAKLLPVLQSLFLSFGPLRCSKSGRSLFDKVSWAQALSVLKTVQLGHVSDPPGVQLYYKKQKKDKYGLTLYRCVRGTNSLEGGVHQNLIRKFGSFGAGPELASAMLVEYRLRHNFDVGTSNRLGLEYKGHNDPWLTQHLDYLRQAMQMADRGLKHLAVEINALKFRGSEEVFGICPLPDEEMQRLGIEKVEGSRVSSSLSSPVYNVEKDLTIPNIKDTVFLKIGSTLRERNSRYQFVASHQRTKYAVIAVHTLEEKLLFGRLLKDVLETSNRITPNFDLLAKKWNTFSEGERVFYKTPEHLEKYHRHWKE